MEAGRYATSEHGAAHGLVVLATGQPYWLGEMVDGFAVAAGNFPRPYTSLGASTAIFAGVG